MNKLAWFFGFSTFAIGSQVFAADVTCTLSPITSFNRSPAQIGNFNYSNIVSDASTVGGLTACNDQMAVRSNFKIASGSSNLTATGSGSFSFGVDRNIEINNSTGSAESINSAKTWLSESLKLSFTMSDDVSTSVVTLTNLDQDYNIHPNTSRPGTVTINGEEYFRAGQGLVNARFSFPSIGVSLVKNLAPSNNIVAALNGATVRIHLGTIIYKYDNYFTKPPTGNPNIASTEIYLNLKLSFARLTCTMDNNQTVSLAAVPASILNSSQTANEQNFNISFSCTRRLPFKDLKATITDSYTPDNINTQGILKNPPTLANKSNVDVQLLDDMGTPLEIGTLTTIYQVPRGSTATTFTKALKARYFRSEATAKSGFVQAQATVFFDYQ